MRAEDLLNRTEQDDDCLRWIGAHTSKGYGQTTLDGKVMGVHRAVYILVHGVIPAGMDIDHTCFVRDCINPEHLEAVTHQENLARSAKAGRNMLSRIDPEFCPKGHSREPSNVRWVKGVNQGCLTCHRESLARKKECRECGKGVSARHMAEHVRAMHTSGKAA